MNKYVTTYACISGSNIEHIWRRKLTKALERSLCGLLSDGVRLEQKACLSPCELCERIQRALDIAEDEKVQNDHTHKY